MLPMRFFRKPAFALANLASLFMFFGMFGSIFLLSQFFQTVQGYSPLGSGLRILPWTLAPMFISPIAGALSDRIRGKTLVGIGLSLQAASLGLDGDRLDADRAYSELIAPFVIAGIGMSLFFAPMAHIVLSAVRPEEEGQASGANNAIRELGGVFGVAVLAAVFANLGGYESGQAFSDGMNPALIIGGVVGRAGRRGGVRDPRRRARPRGQTESGCVVAEAASRTCRRPGSKAEAGRRGDERCGDQGEGGESHPQPDRLGDRADDRRADQEAEVADRRHGRDRCTAVAGARTPAGGAEQGGGGDRDARSTEEEGDDRDWCRG